MCAYMSKESPPQEPQNTTRLLLARLAALKMRNSWRENEIEDAVEEP